MADEKYIKKRYIYVVDQVIGAGAGTIANPTLTIDDNDFVIEEVCRIESGRFDVRVRGTGDDREWSNAFVSDECFFGSTYGQMGRPYRLKTPIQLKARTILTFDLRNQIAGANTVQMCFIGYKKIPV